jgi:GT2 family glycosyltransferase
MLLSIVIATHQRATFLEACLQSLLKQNFIDFEIVIAHSGVNDGTKELINSFKNQIKITYLGCLEKGAATQRNEGVGKAEGEWVVFLDDDVIVNPGFLQEIKIAIEKYPDAGGISGRIENQFFEESGFFRKIMLKAMSSISPENLAGKVIGPALNFLPRPLGKIFEEVEWMPSCVCAYSKKVFLEAGGFPPWFKDYSFCEDLFLSMKVRKKYKLILNRNAVLFHNDQGGKSHTSWRRLALMQMSNRLYIIKHVMEKRTVSARISLYLWYNINSLSALLKGNIKPGRYLSEWIGYTQGLFLTIPS